jgi:hypothetical protein
VSGAVDVVLDQDVVLQHGNLGKLVKLPDDHLAYYRFAPGEELRLTQDGCATPTSLAAFASPLPLGLHPSRAVDACHLVAGLLPSGLAHPEHCVHRVVRGRYGVLPAPATTTAAATRSLSGEIAVVDLYSFVLFRLLCLGGCDFLSCGTPTATTSPAAAAATTLASLSLGGGILC